MFLGFEDSLKSLKKELKDAGVDMSFIRQWQKHYDKVRAQEQVLSTQYSIAKQEIDQVLLLLKDMEQQLISGSADKERVAIFSKEMKKYQGRFNQEFLIGKADSDFQLTYVSIIKQCEKGITDRGNRLILQSEIENLMAVTKEALEKQWPDFKAMAFFYIDRTDSEISELPHGDKVSKVEKIYETEFLLPFRNALTGRISPIRIREIMEDELWN